MALLKQRKIKRLTAKLKRLKQSRLQNAAAYENVAKELKIMKSLTAVYQKLIGHRRFPFAEDMVKETLRAAVLLEDKGAAYALAERLLEEAKFRSDLEKEGLFSSSINAKYAKQLYAEAHAYIEAAIKLGNAEGKRLLGVCFIKGFGVEVDRTKGFDLIIASVEDENSWDRVPEIFSAIAKDDPELFQALMRHRPKS